MSSQGRRQSRVQVITRVRTGCLTCRVRKKKCDEAKPICRGCSRNHLECRWPTSLSNSSRDNHDRVIDLASRETRNQSPLDANAKHYSTLTFDQQNDRASPSFTSPIPLNEANIRLADDDDGFSHEELQGVSSPETVFIDRVYEPRFNLAGNGGDDDTDGLLLERSSVVPRLPSLLPESGPQSPELLQYYLSRTAISMGNGSTELNPFIIQLIPLAFSSDLILQLLLAQSAVHRVSSGNVQHTDVANTYYGKSLQLFRKSVSNYINKIHNDALTITMGSLIMCFTETAKGDVDGAFFNHLQAAKSLLPEVAHALQSSTPNHMHTFLIEYLAYISTVSMISIDPHRGTQVVLEAYLENAAQKLVAENYIGDLCGCWLELLLLVPRIFELGRKAVAATSQGTNFPSADDVIEFSSLQGQIMLFYPDSSVNAEISCASLIFQKAMLLYLLSILNGLPSTGDGMYSNLISSLLEEALTLLAILSPVVRVNTSLCWPIAVIGSLVSQEAHQIFLINRLDAMIQNIGLGNIYATLNLLKHLWMVPAKERSPWTVYATMRKHQIWISFA